MQNLRTLGQLLLGEKRRNRDKKEKKYPLIVATLFCAVHTNRSDKRFSLGVGCWVGGVESNFSVQLWPKPEFIL